MVEFGTSSAFRGWVRVLGYGFGVRGRKVKSRDCALASDLVRAVILTSRKAEPHLNWQLHVHVRAIATITTATAYTPCLALYPCYHACNLPNARGRLFFYQIWSVTDKQTNIKPEIITKKLPSYLETLKDCRDKFITYDVCRKQD